MTTTIATLARKLETQRAIVDALRMTNVAGRNIIERQDLAAKLHVAEADYDLIANKLHAAKAAYAQAQP